MVITSFYYFACLVYTPKIQEGFVYNVIIWECGNLGMWELCFFDLFLTFRTELNDKEISH